MAKIKRMGKHKSEYKIREEQKPFKQHNIYLRQKAKMLEELRNAKIPVHEKMPKKSNFTKFIITKLVTDKLNKETMDKLNEEKAYLKDVNDKILRPTIEYGEIQRNALQQALKRREVVKTKTLLEEILQYWK